MPSDGAIEEVLSPEQLQALIESVPWGVCVTFPNGVVVDKRPMSYPIPTVNPPNYPAAPAYPVYPSPNYAGSAGQMTKMVDPYEAGRLARAASDG